MKTHGPASSSSAFRRLIWAAGIVGTSIGAAYACDVLNAPPPAWVLLLPVYPALLAVIAVAGLPRASGEPRWFIAAAGISVLLWWALIEGWRALRRRST